MSATADPKPPEPSLDGVVADRHAILAQARVQRTAQGFHVATAWFLEQPGRRSIRVIATSDDGFATATYVKWTKRTYAEAFPPPDDHDEPSPPAHGLLDSVATSLRPGTSGHVLGGDGATLFPFEESVRSTDGGRTWTAFMAPRVNGQRGYLTGQVVLADGRLLVNLSNWSGDRNGRPSDVHHGLWASDGDDWGSFTPYEPRFSPPLALRPQKWPAYDSVEATTSRFGSAIWTSSAEGRLYVSTDDAATFTEIPAR